MSRYIRCYVNSVNYGAVVIRGGKPDRRRPEADAPVFSYDAGDALSLDGCVLDLLGHYRKKFTIL